MKNKVILFLAFAITVLSFLPLLNFYKWTGSKLEYFKSKDFYSLDHVIPEVSDILYGYGISLFPRQAIVGHDGWLFLGDDYNSTVTAKRSGASEAGVTAARRSVDAMLEWRNYIQAHGVKDFKVWVGPDKASVYPELAPSWAVTAEQMKVDAITGFDDEGVFVNPRDYLVNAKERYGEELYYKTDTHWNSLGAWVAFDYLLSDLSRTIEFELELENTSVEMHERKGGDLARFLRIVDRTEDREVLIGLSQDREHYVEQYDYVTGELLNAGGNPVIGSPREPIRVVSENALNPARVVWLRDSFGSAMSPYMAAMFSETIQLHYGHANSEWLADIVKDYQPDYVFVTVVERALLGGFFMSTPPLEAVALGSLEYSETGEVAALHHIAQEGEAYEVTGVDPFIVYSFEEPLHVERFSHIHLDISCLNRADEDVRAQVFWSSPSMGGFSETKSVKFSLPQGGAALNLSQTPTWGYEEVVDRIRVDIEPASVDACRAFILRNAEAGHYGS